MGNQNIPPSTLRTILNTLLNNVIGTIPALLPDGVEIWPSPRPYRSIEVDFRCGRKANGDLAFATVLIHSNILAIDSFGHRTRAIADHLSETIQQIVNFIVLSVWCANGVGERQTPQIGLDVFARILAPRLVNGGSRLSRQTGGRAGDWWCRRASVGWIKAFKRRPERAVDVW